MQVTDKALAHESLIREGEGSFVPLIDNSTGWWDASGH